MLRPGGQLLFLYDLQTDNPWIRRYRRRHPERYRELFLEADGHLGYQPSADNRAIFAAAGLHVLEQRGMEKTPLQSASVYTKLAELGGRAAPLLRWAKALGEPPLFYPYTALMRGLDTLVAPLLPAEWARIELTICEK